MKVTLQAEESRLVLELASVSELDQFLDQAQQEDGFFLSLDRELKLYQPLRCSVSTPEGFESTFDIEVMQVFPSQGGATSFGTALRVRDWDSIPIADLKMRLKASSDPAQPETTAQPQTSERKSHPSEVSPIYRIRQMKPPERFRLATKASRPERQILLRDSSPQVLLALLSNPHLEDGDVIDIVKSNFASSGVLQRVAGNRKWVQNQEIQLALVRSPKTPSTVTSKLLPLLPTPHLRMLSKMGNARETLRKAALRIYLERTKRRGGVL